MMLNEQTSWNIILWTLQRIFTQNKDFRFNPPSYALNPSYLFKASMDRKKDYGNQ